MSAESVTPLDKITEYSSFASDIDLLADSPDAATPARWVLIIDAGSGTLDIDTTNETDVALTGVLPGIELRLKFVKINLATNIAKCWVGW